MLKNMLGELDKAKVETGEWSWMLCKQIEYGIQLYKVNVKEFYLLLYFIPLRTLLHLPLKLRTIFCYMWELIDQEKIYWQR